jgi:O-antigen/teichoic acid export membrane protein
MAAKGGGLKAAGSILTILGGLGLGILLTRVLGAAGFGQYRLGIISIELLAQIGALGVPTAALLFIPLAARRADHPRLMGIFRLTCAVPTLIGAVLGTVTFVFSEEISSRVFRDPTFASTLRIFSLAIPLHGLLNASESLARAFNRVDISVIGRDICLQSLKIVATAIVLFAGFGVGGAAVAHWIALAISVALILFLVRRLLPMGRESSRADYDLGRIWRQSLPMYLARLPLALGTQIETLVLGFFGLTSGVGIYAAALQMSRVGEVFPLSIISVALPLISGAYDRGGPEEVRPLLRAGTRWGLSVTLPIFVATALFAEPLLSIFGEEFAAGRRGLVLLAFIPVLRSISGLSAAVLSMTGYARFNSANSICYLAVALALDLLLIPSYGVNGAAIAAFTAMTVLSGLRLSEVFWMFRLWPFDWSVVKPIGAAAVSAVVGFLVSNALASFPMLVEAALGIGSILVAYVVTMIAMGIPEEDRPVLDRLWKRLRRGSTRRR